MKPSTFFLTCILSFFFSQSISAQPRCHSDEKMAPIYAQNEAYKQNIDQIRQELKKSRVDGQRKAQMVVTIPVHVIIVHPGDAEGQGANLSEEHILSQIEVMNQDFRRLNTDAGNTPTEFDVSDSMIEFCMASVDPQGQPTNGITRFETTDDFDNNEFSIKQQTGWPRENYLNFWVADIGALGYAYVPGTGFLPNPVLDGIVCRTSTVGAAGFATHPIYNLGRTATHEIGHYLGLPHIWRNDGCGPDDGFDDTPKQDDENFGCPNHPSPSCDNNGDMFMNYMDYVNDNCMNSFSTEQGEYMQLILNTSRSSILTSANTNCAIEQEILSANIDNTVDAACFGEATGSVAIDASGGLPPYQYSIDGINFFDSNEFFDLPAGDYMAIILDDANSEIVIDFEILEPSQIEFEIVEQENVTCFGEMDGLVVIHTFGDFDVIEFSLDGIEGQATEGLAAGLYTYGITDANGCTATFDFEILEPEEIFLDQPVIFGIGCNGELGAATELFAQGGTGEISFSLDNQTFDLVDQFSDLQAGDYTLYAQDENECTVEMEFSIEPYQPISVSAESVFAISCNGLADGSVVLSGDGGNGDLSYSIDGINYQSSDTFDDLPAGEWTAYAKDANGCEETFVFEILEPNPVSIDNIIVNDATCFGFEDGSVEIAASGGTGALSIMANNLAPTTGMIIENLGADQYSLFVEDENGCIVDSAVTLNSYDVFDVTQSEIIDVLCAGELGTINVMTSGGIGSFTVDIDNFIFSNNTEAFTFDQLNPGPHTFIVSDDAGCGEFSSTFDISTIAPLAEASVLSIAETNDQLGSISFALLGGTAPYEFSIDNVNFQTSALFEDLIAGDYTIFCLDANGCMYSFDASVADETTVSTNDQWLSNVKIWPNPAKEEVFVELPSEIAQLTTIELLGIGGQIYESLATGKAITQLPLRQVSSGIYILKLTFEDKVGYRKIVVE